MPHVLTSPPLTLPSAFRRVSGIIDRLSKGAEGMEFSGDERTVITPFTGLPFATLRDATPDDVTRTFERTRTAQKSWATTDPSERARVLLRFHDLVLSHRDDLLDVLQLEGGKARRHALDEVLDTANVAHYYARQGPAWLRDDRRRGAIPLATKTWVQHVPLGVVSINAPWNYPLTMAVTDALPALMAGNAVVVKPAEQTPFSALFARELLLRAGLPDGLFEIVLGSGPDLGEHLIAGADGLMFTGSTATGRVVAQQAAKRLIPMSLELGGKNPLVVLPDCDLARTVEGVVRACFTNAGQLCISAERLLIHTDIWDTFVPALIARVRAMRVGQAGWDVEMGVLATPQQVEKVDAHVVDARARGATILCGGERLPHLGPMGYAPTLLTDVTPAMDLACDETFGPVATLVRVASDEEAVSKANDSQYGLSASVWGGDMQRAVAIARQIRCGTVNVNEAYIAAWASVDAPMGGMKASGLGRRHGREGFFKFTEAQTIAVQRGFPIAPAEPITAERFADLAVAAMRVIRRLPFG